MTMECPLFSRQVQGSHTLLHHFLGLPYVLLPLFLLTSKMTPLLLPLPWQDKLPALESFFFFLNLFFYLFDCTVS